MQQRRRTRQAVRTTHTTYAEGVERERGGAGSRSACLNRAARGRGEGGCYGTLHGATQQKHSAVLHGERREEKRRPSSVSIAGRSSRSSVHSALIWIRVNVCHHATGGESAAQRATQQGRVSTAAVCAGCTATCVSVCIQTCICRRAHAHTSRRTITRGNTPMWYCSGYGSPRTSVRTIPLLSPPPEITARTSASAVRC